MEHILMVSFVVIFIITAGCVIVASILLNERKGNKSGPDLIVIVRHAESLRNAIFRKGKGPGYLIPEDGSGEHIRKMADQNIPITEIGRKQALATGRAIRDQFGVFDVVYDSGYRRTIETRESILKAYSEEELNQTELKSDYLLRERDPGYFFNLTRAEVQEHFPCHQKYWETFGYFYARPQGGESQADLCLRETILLGKIFREHVGQKILFHTHGGTIRGLHFNLQHWTVDDYMKKLRPEPANCSVSVYRYNEKTGGMVLEKYNEVFWNEKDLE